MDYVAPATTRYQRLKVRTHEVLTTTKPHDGFSRAVDGVIIGLILVNVATFILETVPSLQARYATAFLAIEVLSVAVFTVEYAARLWACTVDPAYAAPVGGRLRAAMRPFLVLDLLAILPFYLPLVMDDGRFLRVVRILRITRVLKLGRYSRAMQSLGRVFRDKREELAVALATSFMVLIIASSIMYFVERGHQPQAFSSIPATMWWGITTLTTVGYGDITPITPLGRFCAAVTQFVGVALFALPTGILAGGFTDEMRRRRAADGRCPTCGGALAEADALRARLKG